MIGMTIKVKTVEVRRPPMMTHHVPAALVIFAISIAAILVVSYCCPELLPDLVRWMIGKVVNS